MGPVMDRGFVAALRRGAIEIVPAVEGFAGELVRLSSGAGIAPDVVVAATGYRPGLEPLVGHLDVLDERGLPLVRDGRGELPDAPGLHFNGYWLPLSGQLPAMRRSSKRIATAIRKRLRSVRS
jgi:putative flavoprotein involved in K+ transport